MFYTFPKRQILDSPKLKEFADDNFKLQTTISIGSQFSKRIENTVGKGEIARYEQFLLFLLSKYLYCRHVKTRACLGKVYTPSKINSIILEPHLEFHLELPVLSTCTSLHFSSPSSYGSLGSIEDLRTGGRWFEPLAWPIFFLNVGDSHCNRIHPALGFSIFLTIFLWESRQWLGKNIVQSTGLKNSSKVWISTLAAAIIEITLETAFNTIQSINQPINYFFHFIKS